MQHIYSHAQNQGNECADHVAALGTFGLVSNGNVRTRWMHPSFDSNSHFALCHNRRDVLHILRDVTAARVSASQRQIRSWHFASLCVYVFLVYYLIGCLAQSMQTLLCGGKLCLTVEAPDISPTSTCPSLLTFTDSDEYEEHNVWNPMLFFFCQEYVSAVVESYLDEAVLGRIALCCHCALDLLCDKAAFHYRPILRLAIAASFLFWSTRLGRLV